MTCYTGAMFNPAATLQFVPIPGQLPCIVIDDFLLDPQGLREAAARNAGAFAQAPHNAFPGLELRMPEDFMARLDAYFSEKIRRHLNARRTNFCYSRLSMVNLMPAQLAPFQRICHHDNYARKPLECFPASVLYLFDNPALGGTSFYQARVTEEELARRIKGWQGMSEQELDAVLGPRAYLTESNGLFEKIATVEARWNRAIFYDGGIYHSSHITAPELLTTSSDM